MKLMKSIFAIRRTRESRDALLAEHSVLQSQLACAALSLSAVQAELSNANANLETLRSGSGPFFHYHSVFDAVKCILGHTAPVLRSHPDYLTNYLGVLIDPKFFPQLLAGRGGEVEGPPIPGNWHADMAEFAAALRAVDLSRGRFTMIELGCGWGCWMNNTGVAARRAGREVHLIGVEADEGHIGFAKEAFAANGFDDSSISLHRGIAASTRGVALFPRQARAGISWGLEPILGATDAQREQAVQSGDYDELPMLALSDLIGPHERIDFLHIDIQGGEADVVETCLPVLQQKVAYMFIGTHSRQIEGRLFHTLLQGGWRLEIERPGLLKLDVSTPYMWVDGVQGWRNPSLLAA
jgi:FkbM family methyltransferase